MAPPGKNYEPASEHSARIAVYKPIAGGFVPDKPTNSLDLRYETIEGVQHEILTFGEWFGPIVSELRLGTQVSVRCFERKDHIAYFEFIFSTHVPKIHGNLPTSVQDCDLQSSFLRFTLSNIVDAPKSNWYAAESKEDETQIAAIQDLAVDFNVSTEALTKIFESELAFASSSFAFTGEILSCALFNASHGAAKISELQWLKSALQAATPERPLRIRLLVASAGFASTLQGCGAGMAATARVNGVGEYIKLLQWFDDGEIDPSDNNLKHLEAMPIAQFDIAAKSTFFSRGEYVTIQYLGLSKELQKAEKCMTKWVEYSVRYAEIANLDQEVYYMFIDFAQSHQMRQNDGQDQQLRVGDRVTVESMSNTEIKGDEAWTGVVIDPPLITPVSNACVMLYRPWLVNWLVNDDLDKTPEQYHQLSLSESTVLPVSDQVNTKISRAKLLSRDLDPVKVKVDVSLNTNKRMLNGLRKLWETREDPRIAQWIKTLLGNSPSLQTPVHPFQYLFDLGVTPEHIKEILDTTMNLHNLTANQKKALSLLNGHIPGGLVIIDGAGGASKSTIIGTFIDFTFKLKQLNAKHAAKIVIVASTNTQVDKIAVKLNRLPSSFRQEEKADDSDSTSLSGGVVVRAHATTTEKWIGRNDAEKERNGSVSFPWEDIEKPIYDLETLAQLQTAKELLDLYQQMSKPRIEGIPDNRVMEPILSVALLVLQIATTTTTSSYGQIMLTHPLAPVAGEKALNTFKIFRNEYQSYARGSGFETKPLKRLSATFKDCFEWVLANRVDVLCSTFSNACTAEYGRIATNSPIHFVIVKDASRLSDPELASLIAYYKPSVIILVGDLSQLEPQHKIDVKKDNFPFAATYIKGPMARLTDAKVPRITMSEQMRMNADICSLLKSVNPAYKGLRPAAAIKGRESTAKVRDAIATLGVKSGKNVVWIEIASPSIRQDCGTKSTSNPGNRRAAMDVVHKLIKAGIKTNDILIITPYRDARGGYIAAIRGLAKNLSDQGGKDAQHAVDVRKMVPVTIDAAPGLEASIVIFDTVVTDKLGFLNLNRIVTAITRARDGLIIIGNEGSMRREHSGNDNERTWNKSALNRVFMHCHDTDCVIR